MAGPAQNTYNRWSAARLVRGCRRLTSGFSFRRLSEMRVSGGFLGAHPSRVRMRMQGVRCLGSP
jgi:hypothetical protein